ncbi:MAG: hypothetical protein HQK50_09710 [Oligoflexia bacterium]|nr:hypothetical protein [Oligoflexia bacterium]MBF0365838.1 hypothetical protein [Oligoflexia bacterium]
MMQVILGLFLLAFGLWGLFDSWNYVLDFFSGVMPLAMMGIGAFSIALYFIDPKVINKQTDDKENTDDIIEDDKEMEGA